MQSLSNFMTETSSGIGKEGTRRVSIVARGGRVRSFSVEFYELAQWVAVPEWKEGGLVLVKQTFVGPLDFLPSRPVFVRYPIYQVCQDGNISL